MMVKKIYHSQISPPCFDLANFPVTETIKMLTCLLEKITKANDSIIQQYSLSSSSSYTCFHARSIPSIDIYSYLTRILKYCPCTNECFLSLLVYFDRMSQQKDDPLRIDSFNIHRLLIAGIMVSSKFFSDVFFTNTRYAKVGGLPVKELNHLELEFFRMNNYDIYVSLEELQQYGNQLLMHSLRVQQLKKDRSLLLDHPINKNQQHPKCPYDRKDYKLLKEIFPGYIESAQAKCIDSSL
ncbi:cyclin-domain-containing protein [Cokeromyces recurvatus]|uniref:cyclin-domain-containing protein n=1 Tax=Cokeromyces recurvatus TaxID=90255 RepID=UPI002220A4B1|nr:cyclin-domain-containing protein [Cokeromyces recurvatus]KAI7906713.1 cyclin-domain-containing protein [Cokeromyces recurvatus]